MWKNIKKKLADFFIFLFYSIDQLEETYLRYENGININLIK